MEKEQGWIFFDIDGTLLYARGAGRKAFRQAFEEALGWDQGVEHINFYGATDLDVFRRICAERGESSTPEMEKTFFERLGVRLDEHLAQTPPELFPNIARIVPELCRHWKLGVVTGNIEATAKAKLKYAGLLDYFEPDGFGCGCDHPDRVEIARLALERAGNPANAVLVGDTPRDVEAATANGMISIAVATGIFDVQTLEKAGADYVFEDLTDAERLMSILTDLG
ncbi:HAD family hydrolase [Tichowtungia aerotolerans]|uniref:phosphoglycolate phosphatase n=1 Tax=Tichowtungia aerotolerans TaxID=2697043 RepID=A0A6P1M814_9BACT|nr:HAD family hydrolase [Tichowtungia aerotolerans]QHI68664.1 HAD hydrolase-like protein [Tichowtungia aerotolerans]